MLVRKIWTSDSIRSPKYVNNIEFSFREREREMKVLNERENSPTLKICQLIHNDAAKLFFIFILSAGTGVFICLRSLKSKAQASFSVITCLSVDHSSFLFTPFQ